MDDAGDPSDPADAGVDSANRDDSPNSSTHGDGAGVPESNESDSKEAATSGPDGRSPDDEENGRRRRVLWLVLLLLLALGGAGIGAFVLEDSPDASPGVETPGPTPAVGEVTLTAPADETMLRASNVVPGDGGISRLVLRNRGSVTGRLGIANVSRTDEENDIASAEALVDDSPAEGELSAALRVRLSVRFPDGRTVRVFGADRFVPLSDVERQNRTYGAVTPGSEVTVVLEWRVPEEVGNEIQSDGLQFGIAFGLRPANGTTP